jgi:hypothetical protein
MLLSCALVHCIQCAECTVFLVAKWCQAGYVKVNAVVGYVKVNALVGYVKLKIC